MRVDRTLELLRRALHIAASLSFAGCGPAVAERAPHAELRSVEAYLAAPQTVTLTARPAGGASESEGVTLSEGVFVLLARTSSAARPLEGEVELSRWRDFTVPRGREPAATLGLHLTALFGVDVPLDAPRVVHAVADYRAGERRGTAAIIVRQTGVRWTRGRLLPVGF